MSTIFKKSIIGSAIALGLLAGGHAMAAELTGNVGVVSDYVFRGETQNDDMAAIQGGLDYTLDSGFHVGTWISSLNGGTQNAGGGGYEMDLYGGYAFTVKNVGMEVGYYTYNYPQGDTNGAATANKYDFGEYYVSASYGMFSAKYSYSPDYLGHSSQAGITDGKKAAYYLEAAVTYPTSSGVSLGFHVGQKGGAFFDSGTQCTTTICDGSVVDYSASLSKGDYSFTVSNMDNKKSSVAAQSDNFRVVVAWKHNITL